jgi:Fe-S cluster assembly protein SufD
MAATAAVAATGYRPQFDTFIAHRQEPDPLLAIRRQALTRLEKLGPPSTHHEAWRFTEVSALDPMPFGRAGDTTVDAAQLPSLATPHHRLAFVNGRFAPKLSRLGELPARALLASLNQALLTHPEVVVAHLDRLPGLSDHPFVARNSTFWEDGAFLYLPPGAVLDQPLHLVFFATGEDTVSLPRTLIVLEEAAQATVVVEYRGDGRYLTCPVMELQVGQGAVLDYGTVLEDSAQAWHLGGLRLHQAAASQVNAVLFSHGGLLSRSDLAVTLDGEGADCQLTGLTLVRDSQLGDQHVRVEHTSPGCRSRQLFKGVLEDKSRTVFDGLIHVPRLAQKTDASQQNRNLLLSRQALASSNPRLEILADDVKCSHGSTVGFLDPDALFYLRSRGIGAAQAQALLVYAFANEIVEHIRLTPLRERLEQLLLNRLYPAAERTFA